MEQSLKRNHIYQVDVTQGLPLPDGCIQTCVTSPPYFGLRSYLADGHPDKPLEIGSEQSPDEYIEKLVAVFREVKRVLRKDGTCWINIGSSYNGSGGAGGDYGPGGLRDGQPKYGGHDAAGYKAKDLIPIPWLLGIALQKDGWWLRSDVIWCKKAPMPSSVLDRPTTATEYVLLLAKNGEHTYWTHCAGMGSRVEPTPDYRWVNRQTGEETDIKQTDKKKWRRVNLWQGHDYYYDREAVKVQRITQEGRPDGIVRDREWGYDSKQNHLRSHSFARKVDEQPGPGQPDQHREDRENIIYDNGRNLWNYWLLGPEPSKEKHYATFPSRIPEIAILAGSSPQACPVCGAPWERMTERIDKGYDGSKYGERAVASTGGAITGGTARSTLGSSHGQQTAQYATTDWQPTCSCPNNDGSGRSIVLDPFMGSGTTAKVAFENGRDYVGCELNGEYVEMSNRRLGKAICRERLFV